MKTVIVNDDFTGEIEGIKHTTKRGMLNVKFDFQKRRCQRDDLLRWKSKSPIELKTGESYRNIKLPANVKVKVYENKILSTRKFTTKLAIARKMKPVSLTKMGGRLLDR